MTVARRPVCCGVRRRSRPRRGAIAGVAALADVGIDRRQPGARLRPGPRRRRGGDGPLAARLRRQGRRRGPHHLRVRRRRGRRPRRQAVRPRGASGASKPARSTAPAEFVADLPVARRSSRRWPTATGPATSTSDFEMVQDTFRRFAEEKLRPVAEHIHRDERRHPRRRHRGPRRDGRLRPVGPRGVRRVTAAAASPTTSAWSSPPRSCPAARSAPAARSSPGPRSSPGRW